MFIHADYTLITYSFQQQDIIDTGHILRQRKRGIRDRRVDIHIGVWKEGHTRWKGGCKGLEK